MLLRSSLSVSLIVCVFLLIPTRSIGQNTSSETSTDNASATVPNPSPVPAKDTMETEKELEDDALIVITGNRDEEALLETPRSLAVGTRNRAREIGATQLPELIKHLPGLGFQETMPGAGLPILRGLVGPDNLLLIDGMRFSTSAIRTGPSQYVGTLGMVALHRLEILRGASSVLYGNGAMGGVINNVTLPAERAGTSWHLQIMGQGQVGGDLALLTAQKLTEGFYLMAGYHRRELLEMNAGENAYIPLGNTLAHDWIAKASFKRGRNRLEAGYIGVDVNGAGRLDKIEQGDVRRYNNDDHFGWLRWHHRSGGTIKRLKLWAGAHVTDEIRLRDSCHKTDGAVTNKDACIQGIDRPLSERDAFEPFDTSHLSRRRINNDVVVAFQGGSNLQFKSMGPLRLQVGFDAAHEQIGSSLREAKSDDSFDFKDKDRGNFSDDSIWTEWGAYLHGDLRLLNIGQGKDMQGLHLRTGIRTAQFGASAPASGGLTEAVETSYTGLVGEAQLALIAPRKGAAWLSWHQGFRAPNLQESTVLGNTGSKFEIPNPELGPQRSDSVEIGMRQKRQRLEISGTLWANLVRDFIDEEAASYEGQTEVDGSPVVKRVNADSATFYGADATLRIQLSPGISLGNQLTYAVGNVHPEGEDSHPARRVPPLAGRHTLIQRFGSHKQRLEFGFSWAASQTELHPSDRKDLRICTNPDAPHQALGNDCTGSPAWYVFDGSYAIAPFEGKPIMARLRLANLLNANYKTHGSGTPAPGTTVTLGLEGRY
ncbi:MAG: TonB-dependent receptor [Myxococcota bacterium]|nr:TonB-dependent receptor [Myxococcota bacterium]